MRSSFEIHQTIALTAGSDYFELHNDFDFVGFEYRSTARTVSMEWRRGVGHWVSVALPQTVFLLFESVSNLAVQKRNDQMPFSEDSCVANITFLPPDFESDFSAALSNYRSENEHFSIHFQSGAGIKIWAESVSHKIII